MGRLLRQRTVSLLALLAACAVVPGAVIHFFGGDEVEIPSGCPLLRARHQRRPRRRRRGGPDGLRRAARRRALGADRDGVLVDGRAALHPRADDAGLPRRHERPGRVRRRGDAPVGGAVLALAVIPELRRPAAVQAGARPAGRAARAHRRARPGRPGRPSLVPAVPEPAARRPGSRSWWASCSTAPSACARRAPICSPAASPT